MLKLKGVGARIEIEISPREDYIGIPGGASGEKGVPVAPC